MIGKTLGNFTCTALLGKGGMGEVYKAKDQKLGRDVAIKVLPEEFAKDADRVARFQREAKLLASLNHPNIASIHGLEESNGIHFLVLELIEGDTLADRLKRGAIPVEEALKLALQIAEALEAAHEKGVIHRDLKPANIKVTPDAKVKVLDFGLAKAFAGDSDEMNLSNSPTLSVAATQQGIILGTAAYMSPEQASGETTDKRTDIWAFGVVLFEMLTGRSLFEGNNVSQTLASVIKSEPEWQSLPPNLHPRIRLLLERCLEKELKDRYGVIGDARVDVQKVLSDPSGIFVQPVTATKPRKKMRLGLSWVAAITILGVFIAGVAVWLLKPAPAPEPKRVTRFEYELPEGQQYSRGLSRQYEYTFAVSPDGNQFVYNTTDGLYLRSIESLDTKLIAGTDKYSSFPFFSPDGKSLGFWSLSDQKLKKVAVSGGAPVDLCDTGPLISGPSWDSEDTILYTDIVGGIMRVPANGGTPETLIEGNLEAVEEEGFPSFPQMLPDGKTLLFTTVFSLSDAAKAQIHIQSLESGERKVIIEAGAIGRYLPTGHIIYSLGSNIIANIFAVPFDIERMKVTGDPVSVLQAVSGYALSESGTLIYVPQPLVLPGATSTALPDTTLVWVDRQGKEEPLGAEPDAYRDPKISPDGTKVAFTIDAAGNRDIWIWDINHNTRTRLTFNKGNDSYPIWTPDGNRIVFQSNRDQRALADVFWKSASGTGETELLISKFDSIIFPNSFSRDGKTLATFEIVVLPLTGADIGMMSMDDRGELKKLLQDEYWELQPQISPDGRYVAYQSDESGKGEIYVCSFSDVIEGKWQVSEGGGDSPLWSPDGRELFYRSGDATMVVEVETDPTFNKQGNPKVLFRGDYSSGQVQKIVLTPWDIHPSGEKFLMVKLPATTAVESTEEEPAPVPQPKIIVVLNWFEELKDRVPIP